MFLVTGGKDGSNSNVDTTETFNPMVGRWAASGAKLPRPIDGLRAVNINDRVLIFGNDNPESLFQSPPSPHTVLCPSNTKFKMRVWIKRLSPIF